MLTLQIYHALFQQVLVELVQIFNQGRREQVIPAKIADFVFYVPFLVRAVGVAKISLETVVHHKPHEHLGQLAFAMLFNMYDGAAHVIEQDA
jgi:hypothetical protein